MVQKRPNELIAPIPAPTMGHDRRAGEAVETARLLAPPLVVANLILAVEFALVLLAVPRRFGLDEYLRSFSGFVPECCCVCARSAASPTAPDPVLTTAHNDATDGHTGDGRRDSDLAAGQANRFPLPVHCSSRYWRSPVARPFPRRAQPIFARGQAPAAFRGELHRWWFGAKAYWSSLDCVQAPLLLLC